MLLEVADGKTEVIRKMVLPLVSMAVKNKVT